jgi:hypothetical protein
MAKQLPQWKGGGLGLRPNFIIYDEMKDLRSPIPQLPASDDTHRTSTASVMLSNDAAVAKVSYQLPAGTGRIFTGTGSSKREREDASDPLVGEALAMARAYEELAARLHRFARGRIKAQDSERRQRELRRSREEWEAMSKEAKLLGLKDASGEFTGTWDTATESIDVTALVRKTLAEIPEKVGVGPQVLRTPKSEEPIDITIVLRKTLAELLQLLSR